MKTRIFTALCLLFTTVICEAQSFSKPDKSPLDCAYFPDNFAHDRKDGEEALIKVYYSRPSKNDRKIFGDVIPYGKVWRTGANEATQVQLYKDVYFDGKKLSAGNYSLFTIPGESEWTIIFNSDLDYWGAYSYKEENDVLRLSVPATNLDEAVESFSIRFKEAGDDEGNMMLAWDKVLVNVPFTY